MCCCSNCHRHGSTGGGTATSRITVGGAGSWSGGGSGYLPSSAYDDHERRHREVIAALAAVEQAIRDLPVQFNRNSRKR